MICNQTTKRRAASMLCNGDTWMPERASDKHLARTIIDVRLYAAGLMITYVGINGDPRQCRDTSFQQWISVMRCSVTATMPEISEEYTYVR